MKKNRLMRIAALMLVLTLATSCFVGGTFAKYVSEVTVEDTARVAAWGFGTSTIDFELFNTSYDTGKVNSSGTDNVIAPGTTQTEVVKLTYANTTGKGAPEVAYTIDLDVVTATIGANIETNPNIKWSFKGTTYEHTLIAGEVDPDDSSWDKMIAAIEAYHEDVAANNLPALQTSDIAITWTWDFVDTPTANTFDTEMGDAASLETVELSIKMIAEQVD